jgi:hypothetical protein
MDKTNNNNNISKNEFLFWSFFEIIYFSIIYYAIVMWVVKLFRGVAYDNYDDFQHVNLIFSQNFISLFWGSFNGETDLRVMYSYLFYFWVNFVM